MSFEIEETRVCSVISGADKIARLLLEWSNGDDEVIWDSDLAHYVIDSVTGEVKKR
jgi:hypothetical protein